MTLTQLEYALQLQKSCSYKQAAECLGITQPALSIQIQKLEDEIGVSLFNRTKSPLEITSDGELFLLRAQDVVTNAKHLNKFAEELKEDFNGSLVVGIIPTLAPFLIPLFSKSLQEKYPNLQLEFQEQLTETVVRNVRSGEIDAGIISTPIDVTGIHSLPLFYERFYVYSFEGQSTPPDIRLEDINFEDLWLLDEGNCFRDQVSNFCDLKSVRKGKKFIYHSNSIDALIRIVDSHGGLTILPELTTLSLTEHQEDNLKTIRGKQKAREIGLIISSSYSKLRYINLLEEYIKSNIPRHMLSKKDYEIVDPGVTIK